VGIVSFLMGWTLVFRLLSLGGIIHYGATDTTGLVVGLSVISQILFLGLVAVVVFRLRRFMRP
jgi:hypothetical protein